MGAPHRATEQHIMQISYTSVVSSQSENHAVFYATDRSVNVVQKKIVRGRSGCCPA